MKKNHKIVAGGTALLLAMGLGLAAVGSTSAYFSDTNSGGAITVTAGSIYVTTDDSLKFTSDLEYTNVLPGDTVAKDVAVENSGSSAQDVYLVVDEEDLSKAQSAARGKGDLVVSVGENEVARLSTMDTEVQLASNLAAGDEITVTFTLEADTDTEFATGRGVDLPYSIVATQPGIEPGA